MANIRRLWRQVSLSVFLVEDDPQRSVEEKIAKGVAWVVYAGTWCT